MREKWWELEEEDKLEEEGEEEREGERWRKEIRGGWRSRSPFSVCSLMHVSVLYPQTPQPPFT